MKLSSIIVLHPLLYAGLTIARDNPNFTAVFSYKNLTAFYEHVRHIDTPSDMYTSNLPEIKKRICEQITNSQFFRLDDFEYIDPEAKPWYSKLKGPKHRDTFKELFKRGNAGMVATIVGSNYVYENVYVTKDVRFDEVVAADEEPPLEDRPPTPGRQDKLDVSALGQRPKFEFEHVFLCLTRKKNSTKDFQKWYVTKEYNTRLRTKRPEPATFARFVLKLSETDKKFELVALATEPAVEYTTSPSLQTYYMNSLRRDRRGAKSANEDPLCRLISDLDEYCLLCSAVMNSQYFLEVAEIVEPCENVKRRCVKMEVVLTVDFPGDRQYFEYVTPCKAQLKKTKKTAHYFLSRAYRNDAVLVFQPNPLTPGKVSIVRMFTNVSVTDSREVNAKDARKLKIPPGTSKSRSKNREQNAE